VDSGDEKARGLKQIPVFIALRRHDRNVNAALNPLNGLSALPVAGSSGNGGAKRRDKVSAGSF